MNTDRSAHIQIECRPAQIFAARYAELPFPNIGPVQETAFDVGVTAHHDTIELTGFVFKGYSGHQMLFEQRWTADIVRRRTGEQHLAIEPGMGLALRSLHFLLHGYEPLTHLEITAVARVEGQDRAAQAVLQVPVSYPKQRTNLYFPLQGAWWAIQASDWSDQHKVEVHSQTYAVDFVKLGQDNRPFQGTGMALSDHYSWGQPVFAAAGGKVAHVSYDMPDMLPGAIPDPVILRGEPSRVLGNAVAISHANGEFSYYAHLQQASIDVSVGDLVRRGTRIARVGNSGNSPGPHLHFHLMNGPNLFIDQGLPLAFSHFWAAGQFFETLTTIPTRMIVIGPGHEDGSGSEVG